MLKTTVAAIGLLGVVAYSGAALAQSSETTTTTTAQPMYPTETSKGVERHIVNPDGTQVDSKSTNQRGYDASSGSSQVEVTNPDGSQRTTTHSYEQSNLPAPSSSTTSSSTTTTQSP